LQTADPLGASGQTFLQALQLFTLIFRFTSQPLVTLASQLAKPGLQVMLHVPPLQLGTPLVLLHAVPQALQLPASVSKLTSQPLAGLLSQSAQLASHLATVQVLLVQSAVA
jgi:hypothetical protein